uniref:Protein MIS12 homolog n=1 Tax=Salmo trutta TaxID=8032 RepID=A0A673ZHL6_SALTR
VSLLPQALRGTVLWFHASDCAFQDCLNELRLVVEAVFVRKLSGTEECSQKLQIFLQERFKRLSCRMDTVLVNNVLSVPPNMLLPDDQPHKKYFQRLEEAEVCGRQALLAELEEQREQSVKKMQAVIGEVNNFVVNHIIQTCIYTTVGEKNKIQLCRDIIHNEILM